MKNKLFFIPLILFLSGYANAGTPDALGKAPASGFSSVDNYIAAFAGNLNDFSKVGLLIASVSGLIAILYNNENGVKAFGKVAFGVFLLKSSVMILNAIIGA